MFLSLMTIIRVFYLYLTKVIFMLKHSVKLRRYMNWWSRGSVLAFSTQVCGFNPTEAVGFLGRKNPQHTFLRRGSKAVGPMS